MELTEEMGKYRDVMIIDTNDKTKNKLTEKQNVIDEKKGIVPSTKKTLSESRVGGPFSKSGSTVLKETAERKCKNCNKDRIAGGKYCSKKCRDEYLDRIEAEDMKDYHETHKVKESWDTKMDTPESKKGMFKGRTKASLRSQLSKAKARSKKLHDADKTEPESLKKEIKRLEFALRAKNKFGKVSESSEKLEEDINNSSRTITIRWEFQDTTAAQALYNKLEQVSDERDAWLQVIDEIDTYCFDTSSELS